MLQHTKRRLAGTLVALICALTACASPAERIKHSQDGDEQAQIERFYNKAGNLVVFTCHHRRSGTDCVGEVRAQVGPNHDAHAHLARQVADDEAGLVDDPSDLTRAELDDLVDKVDWEEHQVLVLHVRATRATVGFDRPRFELTSNKRLAVRVDKRHKCQNTGIEMARPAVATQPDVFYIYEVPRSIKHVSFETSLVNPDFDFEVCGTIP